MASRLVRSNYYQELEIQKQINEEQLDKLEDLLFIQKLKAAFYLVVAILILALLVVIATILLSGNRFELADRYSTLINIGSVFLFFGLVETFLFFIASLSLTREIRRLIRRQESALREAKAEFVAA
jgi:hypothetical protein